MCEKKKGQSYYTNRHGCFLLQYQMILITNNRKPVLAGSVKDKIYSIIRDISKDKKCNILELSGGTYYLNLEYEAGPELSPLEMVNVIKTKTARLIRRDCKEEIKKYYENGNFWSQSYFIATVNENSNSLSDEYMQDQRLKTGSAAN